MKCVLYITFAASLSLAPFAAAYNTPTALSSDLAKTMWNRRTLMAGLVTAALGSVTTAAPATAEPTVEPTATPLESVYFGVGCFWHIQHEFVAAEGELLGRSNRELTSVTGYAGGKAADSFGRVCYHNFQQVADYGKLGHGEAVGMQLPTDKIVEFAAIYFSLFNPKTLGACM